MLRAPTTDAGVASRPSDVVDRCRASAPHVYELARVTPCIPSRHLGEASGGRILLKAECLQRTGAFKIRGALAKMASLGVGKSRGVVAASAGNHGQAVALAARHLGISAEIFVPRGAALGKVAACREYGGVVVDGGATVEDAVMAARRRAAELGSAFCHPYDDLDVVAGQATLGFEILDQEPDLDQVVVPLGGGGLLAGIAAVIRERAPRVRVVGVHVRGWTPHLDSLVTAPTATTLADGIAVSQRGAVTGPIIDAYVDDVVAVGEDDVADAMALLLERSKMCVEGAGAVGVAALLDGAVRPTRSGTTCIVLSGGNVDLGVVPNVIRRHETIAGRRVVMRATLPDRPGVLADLLAVVAATGANVIDVFHVRDGITLHVKETVVRLVLEVKGSRHAADVVSAAAAQDLVLGIEDRA